MSITKQLTCELHSKNLSGRFSPKNTISGKQNKLNHFIIQLLTKDDHNGTFISQQHYMFKFNYRNIFCSFCSTMLCKHGLCRHAVFVHLSVTFVDSVKINKHIFKMFSTSVNHAIQVFSFQTSLQKHIFSNYWKHF